MTGKFPAIYRGHVVDNIDPEERGRIKVQVPSVLGEVEDAWALPSVPYAGQGVGLFVIPPIGADIWVQFEGGDHTLPVWTGCYWTKKDDVPISPAHPDLKVFRTPGIAVCHSSYQDDTPTSGDVAVKRGFTLQVESPILEQGTFLRFFLGVDGLIEINNSNQEVIRMNVTNILVAKDNQSTITLTNSNIVLSTLPAQISLLSGSDKIDIKNREGRITLSPSGIETTIGASDQKLDQNGITMSYVNDTVQLTASGVSISNGTASVNLSGPTTAINVDALVVE